MTAASEQDSDFRQQPNYVVQITRASRRVPVQVRATNGCACAQIRARKSESSVCVGIPARPPKRVHLSAAAALA